MAGYTGGVLDPHVFKSSWSESLGKLVDMVRNVLTGLRIVPETAEFEAHSAKTPTLYATA